MNTLKRKFMFGVLVFASSAGIAYASQPFFVQPVQAETAVQGTIISRYSKFSFLIQNGNGIRRVFFNSNTVFSDRFASSVPLSSFKPRDKVVVRGWDMIKKNRMVARSIQNLSLPRVGVMSGLSGTVLIGPNFCQNQGIRPSDCPDKPYSATIQVWDESKQRKITKFTSAQNGTFTAYLLPGTYYLEPLNGPSKYPRGVPQTVTIRQGQMISITIQYDTGIRF